MANLRIYFELLSKQLSISPRGPLGYNLPPQRNEDILSLEIGLLRQVSGISGFEEVTVTGWSLRTTIGTVGSSLATTTSFSVDSSGKLMTGELALNTAGIAALTDNQEVYFEIIATLGTSIYGKRFPVRIEKGIYTSGALVSPPGDVAIGQAYADRAYVKREGGAGEGFILKAENGVRAFVYLDNDGQLRASPIT